MAQFILMNAKVFADQYEVSGYLSQGEIQKASDIHDVTPFGATEHRFAAGLQGGNWTFQGFTEFGTTPAKIEKIMNTLKGQLDKSLTVIPEGPALGNVSIFLPASFGGYDFGGPHGNPNTFTWNGGTSKWQPIGGFVEELGITARTTTGQTAGQNLGAVASNQFLYAAVHVLQPATGTMDLLVESGTTGAFPAPITRITFPQFTSIGGGGILRAAGPITDTFFRFKYTLGTTPSFIFAASFGIA